MDSQQFVEHGKTIFKYLTSHDKTITEHKVLPLLKPGFLVDALPDEAPLKGESFEDILDDIKTKIVPGMTNWHHPNFYAYFPLGHSYASILGELLISGLGGLAFSWNSSPAFTELETIVLEMFAKAANLPEFLYKGEGGGAIYGSASEVILLCLIAARDQTIRQLKAGKENVHESVFLPQLVAYTSSMAHSSVPKAFKMALVQHRILDADAHGRLDSNSLRAAIAQDVANGLTPFFVLASIGTTGGCAFDDLNEIGQVCREYPSIWYHVDGAYGGTAFILPEMRHFMKGMEFADSFNTNPTKLMLVSHDASFLYVKDVECLKSAVAGNEFHVNRHEHESEIDYQDYGIQSGRRTRALKIWFVFRSYGIEGIQRYMRNHMALAKRFEQHVKADERFEVMNDVYLGLVCYRLVHSCTANRDLLNRIQQNGEYHMIPAMIDGKYVIRFCLNYEHAREEHIDNAWSALQNAASHVLANQKTSDEPCTLVDTL